MLISNPSEVLLGVFVVPSGGAGAGKTAGAWQRRTDERWRWTGWVLCSEGIAQSTTLDVGGIESRKTVILVSGTCLRHVTNKLQSYSCKCVAYCVYCHIAHAGIYCQVVVDGDA